MRLSRDDRAIGWGLAPVLAAVAFLLLAPSEGANIGGGILVLFSVPLGIAIYSALRPRDPARRRRLPPPSEW
jgi:hypothetical protein